MKIKMKLFEEVIVSVPDDLQTLTRAWNSMLGVDGELGSRLDVILGQQQDMATLPGLRYNEHHSCICSRTDLLSIKNKTKQGKDTKYYFSSFYYTEYYCQRPNSFFLSNQWRTKIHNHLYILTTIKKNM